LIRAYLQLVRAPAAFSAASNILAAQLVVGALDVDWHMAGLLLVVSVSLYSAGMAMNDCYDLGIDSVERPDRPIPSGRVPLRNAYALIILLIIVAMIAGVIAGPRHFFVAMILVLAIWLYNARAKQGAWGPPVMGLCRYLNWILGLSTVANWTLFWFVVPLPVFVYIWAVSSLGRDEMAAENRANVYILGIGVLVSVALISIGGLYNCSPCGLYLLAAIGWMLLMVSVLRRLIRKYTPERIRDAMRVLILAVIPLDALILVSFGNMAGALLVLGLLLPSWFLARKIYVS